MFIVFKLIKYIYIKNASFQLDVTILHRSRIIITEIFKEGYKKIFII